MGICFCVLGFFQDRIKREHQANDWRRISVQYTVNHYKMNRLFQKHRIMESLNDLDHAQTELVLDYIRRLARVKREERTLTAPLKREAMLQIRQALGKGRGLQQ